MKETALIYGYFPLKRGQKPFLYYQIGKRGNVILLRNLLGSEFLRLGEKVMVSVGKTGQTMEIPATTILVFEIPPIHCFEQKSLMDNFEEGVTYFYDSAVRDFRMR